MFAHRSNCVRPCGSQQWKYIQNNSVQFHSNILDKLPKCVATLLNNTYALQTADECEPFLLYQSPSIDYLQYSVSIKILSKDGALVEGLADVVIVVRSSLSS